MHYEALFVSPFGRAARAHYIPAMITVLAAIAFFGYYVGGRTAQFCMLVLLYPAFVLLANRVRDMGFPALVVILPAGAALLHFAVWLGYLSVEETVETAVLWISLTLSAVFVLLGATVKGRF